MDHKKGPLTPSLTESVSNDEVKRPISEILSELSIRAAGSDEHRIAAAFLCREIRRRIEEGELGPSVNWRAWMLGNIRLKPSDLYLLMAIASAADPRTELARQRGLGAARQRKYAADALVRVRERDPRRLEVIRWIKNASDENVTRILRQISAIESFTLASALRH
jgi:hypothetical protein